MYQLSPYSRCDIRRMGWESLAGPHIAWGIDAKKTSQELLASFIVRSKEHLHELRREAVSERWIDMSVLGRPEQAILYV